MTSKPRIKSPTHTESRGNGQPAGQLDVGAGLSDAELIRHVQDCGRHMLAHYERFETLGDPADRDAAVQWLHAQQEAQRALQRHLDEGLDYFATAGARDRCMLERRAA